jgi:hypothetical protein
MICAEYLLGVSEVDAGLGIGVQLDVDAGTAMADGTHDDDDGLGVIHIEDGHARDRRATLARGGCWSRRSPCTWRRFAHRLVERDAGVVDRDVQAAVEVTSRTVRRQSSPRATSPCWTLTAAQSLAADNSARNFAAPIPRVPPVAKATRPRSLAPRASTGRDSPISSTVVVAVMMIPSTSLDQ